MAATNTGLRQLYAALSPLPNQTLLATALNSVGTALGSDTVEVWAGADKQVNVTSAGGTVVFAITSNVPTLTNTSGGTPTWTISIPLDMVVSNNGSEGLKLTGGTVYYNVGTAALTSSTLALNRVTFANPPTGAAVATTCTMATTTGDKAVTWTVDTPFYMDGDANGHSLSIVSVMQNTGTMAYKGTLFTFSRV